MTIDQLTLEQIIAEIDQALPVVIRQHEDPDDPVFQKCERFGLVG